MRKSDESIKKLVTASIRRHSIDIETWDRTKLWDEWSNEYRNRIENIARFKDSELGIISYPKSDEYWYVITTQRVIICEKEQPRSIDIDEIDHYDFWGDFKGVH